MTRTKLHNDNMSTLSSSLPITSSCSSWLSSCCCSESSSDRRQQRNSHRCTTMQLTRGQSFFFYLFLLITTSSISPSSSTSSAATPTTNTAAAFHSNTIQESLRLTRSAKFTIRSGNTAARYATPVSTSHRVIHPYFGAAASAATSSRISMLLPYVSHLPAISSQKLLLFSSSSSSSSSSSLVQLAISSSSTSSTTALSRNDQQTLLNGDDTTSSAISNNKKENQYDDYYDPNWIQPQTDPLLPTSVAYFVQFTLNLFRENRRRKHLLHLRRQQQQQSAAVRLLAILDNSTSTTTANNKAIPRWYQNLIQLNQQRKNLVILADYTAKIVAPSFLFLMLGALTTSIVPRYSALCIQLVATLDTNRYRVLEALGGLAIFTTLEALFTGMRGSLFWIAGTRANYNIRVKLHRSLLLQEAAFFDSHETGYLLSRLNSDVNKIGSVISYHVNVVCRQLAQFIFGSLYMIKISPYLSAYAFLGILLVAWVSVVYGAFNRDLAQRVQNTYAEATAVAETSFSMAETIRAFDGVDMESQKYEAAQRKALQLEEVQAWGYGTHKFVSDKLQAGLHLILLLACWHMGTAGGLPASELVTFLFYAEFVLQSSNEVGDQWAKIQGAVGASTSVFDLIRRVPSIRDPPGIYHPKRVVPLTNQTTFVPHCNGVMVDSSSTLQSATNNAPILDINNLTIKYGAMENPALSGVDLHIYHGDRVAIVGRSGSGKSSMLRALLRFYDPSIGSVKLHDKDLREMSRTELAKNVAFVEQEPALFPMTLLDNVLYGFPKDSYDSFSGEPCYSDKLRKLVVDSLSVVGLPIQPGNDLNLDLDTRVGDGGRALSGGQRQRVAIARALIRSPAVLLLDEPTSALDSESEKQVIGALRKAMEQSECMVMVTHRLGAIRSLGVTRVVVMDKGKIIECGHPESLLLIENGRYASLAREQGILSSKSQTIESN